MHVITTYLDASGAADSGANTTVRLVAWPTASHAATFNPTDANLQKVGMKNQLE